MNLRHSRLTWNRQKDVPVFYNLVLSMPIKPKKPQQMVSARCGSSNVSPKKGKAAKRSRTGGRNSAVAEAMAEVEAMTAACQPGDEDSGTDACESPPRTSRDKTPSPTVDKPGAKKARADKPASTGPVSEAVQQPGRPPSSRLEDQTKNKLEEETQKRAAAEARIKALEEQLKAGNKATPSKVPSDSNGAKSAKKTAKKVCP